MAPKRIEGVERGINGRIKSSVYYAKKKAERCVTQIDIEQMIERDRIRRENKKEKYLIYQKKYRKNNAAKIREYNKKYKEIHNEQLRNASLKYRKENGEKITSTMKRLRDKNKDKYAAKTRESIPDSYIKGCYRLRTDDKLIIEVLRYILRIKRELRK